MARARSSRLSTGYQPRKWQHEVSANKRRYNVIVVHRRAGKSELGVAELIHEAVHAKATPQNSGAPFFVYLAPYLKQAKVLAWDRLRTYARRLGLTINESELSVSFPHNGAKIQVFGGDNPDALRGVGLDGIVLDELKDLKPEIWYEVVLPALADRRGWAMLIGTPKGVNLLSELYHYGSRKQDWYTAIFTVYQTGVFTAAEIEELRDQMGENEFNREFLCDLTAAGEDQLIGLGLVEEACRRNYREIDVHAAPRVLGVDIARFGDDSTVFVPRQGLICYPPKVFKGLDNMAITGHLVEAIRRWKPDAVFIDVGAGTGVIDRMRQLSFDVNETNFASKATDPRYANKRAEMWFRIKEWLGQGGCVPDLVELKQDLTAPNYKFDASNRYILESKGDMRKRLLRSPDIGDALALTFAEHVAPRVEEMSWPLRRQLAETNDYSRALTDYAELEA